jgi:hypothetical protein
VAAAADITDLGTEQAMAAQELLSLVQTEPEMFDIIRMLTELNISTDRNGFLLRLAVQADLYKLSLYTRLKP